MLLRVIVNAVALLAVFFLLWDVRGNDAIVAALVMAVVVTLINSFIRPVILLLTLPVSIFTLGLFALLVNALLFWLAAGLVHIHVGFGQAFVGYLLFVVVSFGLNQIAKEH
ncbi:MAG TPA: phage holin family protein [Candidatus Dormibacteraeota bacterium]|jgi:putative membrane protein|nr:phage holin family protein [Candidatus Dormibacteraeota bacterium]